MDHMDETAMESYRERALEDVVETIVCFCEYPQPATIGSPFYRLKPRQFDLYEFVQKTYDKVELNDFAVSWMMNNRDDFDRRSRAETELRRRLTLALRKSPIVEALAISLTEED